MFTREAGISEKYDYFLGYKNRMNIIFNKIKLKFLRKSQNYEKRKKHKTQTGLE